MTNTDNEWQRVTKNDDNKWQRMTTSDNKWSFWLIFLFFRIREEPTTMHPKETLNIEEDLEERLLK